MGAASAAAIAKLVGVCVGTGGSVGSTAIDDTPEGTHVGSGVEVRGINRPILISLGWPTSEQPNELISTKAATRILQDPDELCLGFTT